MTPKIYTLAEMRRANKQSGKHFFDEGENSFFNTRYESEPSKYNMFITSETYDENRPELYPRRYSLRLFVPKTSGVETVGDFNVMTKEECEALRRVITKALDSMQNREREIFDHLVYVDVWGGSPGNCLEFIGQIGDERKTFVIRLSDSRIIQ